MNQIDGDARAKDSAEQSGGELKEKELKEVERCHKTSNPAFAPQWQIRGYGSRVTRAIAARTPRSLRSSMRRITRSSR